MHIRSLLFSSVVSLALAAPVLADPASSAAAPVASSVPTAMETESSTLTHPGEMGIQVSLPGGGDPTLGATYFLTENGALRVDLGLGITSAKGTPQQVSVQAGYRAYLASFEHFKPFFQPAIWIGNPGATFTFSFEGGVGGEYFVTKHFSFGAQTGVALTIATPSGGSAVVRFATGTSSVFGQFLW